MRFDNQTICLYGDTDSGKSFLLSELTAHLKDTKKQRSVVYLADRGWLTLRPQMRAGNILPVPLIGDPFNWLAHVCRGEVLDAANKWVKAPDDIGLFAYDSGTGIGTELNRNIRESHSSTSRRLGDDGKAKTVGIGPAANPYKVGSGDEILNKASLDKAHFGIMQNELRDAIWQSQDLPGIVLWTFLALRKQDDDTKNEIIGPDPGVGKALTTAIPSWFHYTFHTDTLVRPTGECAHRLYLSGHTDMTTGNARTGSNARVPFGAEKMPSFIEPASLVKALSMLEERQVKTENDFRKKYGV